MPKIPATTQLDLMLLQANVLSLNPPGDVLTKTSPRMEELDRTFFTAGADIVFIQEA